MKELMAAEGVSVILHDGAKKNLFFKFPLTMRLESLWLHIGCGKVQGV